MSLLSPYYSHVCPGLYQGISVYINGTWFLIHMHPLNSSWELILKVEKWHHARWFEFHCQLCSTSIFHEFDAILVAWEKHGTTHIIFQELTANNCINLICFHRNREFQSFFCCCWKRTLLHFWPCFSWKWSTNQWRKKINRAMFLEQKEGHMQKFSSLKKWPQNFTNPVGDSSPR